jgi:aryl-alcohol dehydrogenase-like predicted oxidoreductase
MQFCAEKNSWTKFVSMQNHYNLLYREEEREMNKFCKETGVGLIPWAPLCRGYLARPPSSTQISPRSLEEQKMGPVLATGHTESDRVIINRVQELAEKKGWKMSTVALAWINKRVSSPIVGFSSVERIDDALAARGKELTEDDEKYLEEPYVTRDIQGHS